MEGRRGGEGKVEEEEGKKTQDRREEEWSKTMKGMKLRERRLKSRIEKKKNRYKKVRKWSCQRRKGVGEGKCMLAEGGEIIERP